MGRVDELRDPEVVDQCAGRAEKDVAWFEVPVRDALGVHVGERLGEPRTERHCLVRGKPPFGTEPISQRRPVHELEYQERLSFLRSHGVGRDHSRVSQASQDFDLLSQPVLVGPQHTGMKQLDRDIAPEHAVMCAVDASGAPAAQQLPYLITAPHD